MRAVVQRVKASRVEIEGNSRPDRQGLMILLGVRRGYREARALSGQEDWNLRIFTDENDKMNLSLLDIGGRAGGFQVTLYADCKKGRRPPLSQRATARSANGLYEHFVTTN
ncbi:MAG: D-aminoacyl-tRNA deacylase [Acutalibacteraceae bacterium]